MRCATVLVFCLGLTLPGPSAIAAQTPPTTPPTTTTPPAKPAQTPPAAKPRQTAPPARGFQLTVMVTALDGRTLPEVVVRASGAADREARTDPSGLVTFANMPSGTYRLRFEHPEFTTFEKEVSLAAGRPLRVTATLTAAPPPPPPPKPEPPPAPTPTAVPDGSYQPTSMAILEFLDKNFIGGAPSRRSPLGCTASSTSTLLQLREPLGEHVHGDEDEVLYLLTGEATHKVGGKEQQISAHTFLVVPRGVPHSLVRRGRNPLTVISTLTGAPCTGRQ